MNHTENPTTNLAFRFWPETPSRRAARGVLAYLAGVRPEESDASGPGAAQDVLADLERRLVALDALGALDRWLPTRCVLAPVEPCPGDIEDAYRLLTAALQESYAYSTHDTTYDSAHDESGTGGTSMSARDVLATGLAAARLRPLLDGSDE